MKLTRPERSNKFLLSYFGHALQGCVAGFYVPWLFSSYLYVNYQKLEYTAYYNRNKDGEFIAGDTPSRDIADYLIGYYIGSTVSTILIGFVVCLML